MFRRDWEQMKSKQRAHTPTFAEAAHLIVPIKTPAWLPAYLEWASQGLRYDRLVEEYRPTKLKAKERLAALRQATQLIEHELDSILLKEFLEIEPFGPLKDVHGLKLRLRDVANRAEHASASPLISRPDGATKRGRKKAMLPSHFPAKTLCAARVLEMWLHFQQRNPGSRNLKLADATEAYWCASGGRPSQALTGWRKHFDTVKANETTPSLIQQRLIWRRELAQIQKSGKPPWYIGTYYPLWEAEFRSTIQA
jgi:hypothetical protein